MRKDPVYPPHIFNKVCGINTPSKQKKDHSKWSCCITPNHLHSWSFLHNILSSMILQENSMGWPSFVFTLSLLTFGWRNFVERWVNLGIVWAFYFIDITLPRFQTWEWVRFFLIHTWCLEYLFFLWWPNTRESFHMLVSSLNGWFGYFISPSSHIP